MKKVLITGANSYIGNATEEHLRKTGFDVSVLDMKGDWRGFDFSPFDAVFHVAGIAHDTQKKNGAELYYRVNFDLAVETAKKAKSEGVKQFIFMSSMLVYNGVKKRHITLRTVPKIKGCYGDSKLKADLALQEMNSEAFKVVILRPPMIYGKDCKGNFPRLISLADKLFMFPNIKNKRSVLYIDNLTRLIELVITSDSDGIFFPQDADYFCTSEAVKHIATVRGKKIRLTRLLNPLVYISKPFLSSVKKLFGNLTYDKALSNHFDGAYQIKTTKEALKFACIKGEENNI